MNLYLLYLIIFYNWIDIMVCQRQTGPDPWHYDNNVVSIEENLPPDIKTLTTQKTVINKRSAGIGEWAFRRTVAILIKGSRTQRKDEGDIEISTHMKFNNERWETLNSYLESDEPFSEETFRRVLGYIEGAIYKPTIVEETIMAWNEYVHTFLLEYKVQITYALITLSIVGMILWSWRHIKQHKWKFIFVLLYFYHVIISYKEAEQKEFETFLSAIQKCKWQFWSECEAPKPDLLTFYKHMDPLKIAVRMFSVLISEPMIITCDTVNTILLGITDGLYFPLNKIVHGLLMILIVVVLLLFLFITMYNTLLSAPALLGSGLKRLATTTRRNEPRSSPRRREQQSLDTTETIQPATIDRLLDVCARALDTAASNNRQRPALQMNAVQSTSQIRRSASTGRLPSLNISKESCSNFSNNDRKNKFSINASGDH